MKICKRTLMGFFTLLLSTALLCGCGAPAPASTQISDHAEVPKESAFVTIDINPSIELTLDRDRTVTAVGAVNTDAEILLWQEELVGMELEPALERIVALAVEMGYVTEENTAISVTVTTEGGKTEDALLRDIDETLVNAVKDAGMNVSVEEGLDLVLSKELARVKEENAGKEGYDDSLTLARYRLVKSALRADRELTMDEAVLMTNKKLTETVETARQDAADRFGHTCELARSEAAFIYDNAKQTLLDSAYTAVYTARRDLSSLLANYGAAYAGCRLAYRTVEHYAQTLRELVENPIFTADDVFALANALGIDTAAEAEYDAFKEAITDEDGNITRDSVNAYIDQQYRNMDEDDRAALEKAYDDVLDILDRLEIEAGVIHEDGKLLISGSIMGLGLSVSVETYEDLPALLAAIEKKADDIYTKMESDLTENEKADVAELQEKMSAKIAELEKTYLDAVEKAQAEAEAYLSKAKDARTK